MAARTSRWPLLLAWSGWLLGLALCAVLLRSGPPGLDLPRVSPLPPAPASATGSPPLPSRPPALLAAPEVNSLVPALNNRGQVVLAEESDVDPLAAFRPPPAPAPEARHRRLAPDPAPVQQQIAAKQQELLDEATFRAALKKYEAALADRSAAPRGDLVPAAGWGPLINKYARQHNVDPRLVWAVMRQESGFNPQAVSPKGAMGLMQLIPGTAALMGVIDPFDPEENIRGGVRYLRHCLDKFNNNVVFALAAYNAGPDNVAKYQGCPPFAETRTYVLKVMRDYTGAWIDLPVPPPTAKRSVASGAESHRPEASTPAPPPPGLAWKIAKPTFKMAKPTWKIPLAGPIMANRLPAEIRQHPEVSSLLAKKGGRRPLPELP